MNWTVNFDYQSCLGAIEVHQKATDSVLAPKLETGQIPIAQCLPEVRFCRRWLRPVLPR
jgi:hypothetical protein